MIKNISIGSVFLSTGARFDQQGGLSALGVLPPTVVINSTMTLASLSVFGSVWNKTHSTIKGELVLLSPDGDEVSKNKFQFGPTGAVGSLFIINFKGNITFSIEGEWKVNLRTEENILKNIHNFHVKKIAPNTVETNVPFPGLSLDKSKELREKLNALLSSYLTPKKD